MIDMTLNFSNSETKVYRVSKKNFTTIILVLMDGDANRGLGGTDNVLALYPTGEKVNIVGIDEHLLNAIELRVFALLIKTSQGAPIFLSHYYAKVPTQRTTIHSKVQLDSYRNIVDNLCSAFGGKQGFATPCGCIVPILYKDGLLFCKKQKPTPEEVEKYPQINLTDGNKPWNPKEWDSSKTADNYLQGIEDTILRSLEIVSEKGDFIIVYSILCLLIFLTNRCFHLSNLV